MGTRGGSPFDDIESREAVEHEEDHGGPGGALDAAWNPPVVRLASAERSPATEVLQAAISLTYSYWSYNGPHAT